MIAVVAIVVVAAVLRGTRLGTQSFWVDEINVLSFVRSGQFLSDLRERGGPFELPLHFVAVWLASFLPLGFETAARVPSAVFGTLEVLGLMLVARRLTARIDVALIAGAFLAVAPFAVRYSQENRYYTTFSALQLLSWWLVLRAEDRGSRAAFAWWGVMTAMLLLSHPFALPVVGAELVALWLLGRRARRREDTTESVPADRVGRVQGAAIGVGVAVLLAAPWFIWGLARWVPDVQGGRSYQLNPRALGPVTFDSDLFKRVAQWLLANGGRWTLLSGLLMALAIVAVVATRGDARRTAALIWLYVVGFVIALVPFARVLNTYLAMRRIEFLVPWLLLLAAIGIIAVGERFSRRSGARDRLGRWWRWTTIGAVIALSTVALGAYFVSEKTDYRELANVIARTPSDDLVVVGPVDYRWRAPIRRYLKWQGVDRRVVFVVPGIPRPDLTMPASGKVLWVTGARPGQRGFRTRSLNSLPDLQVIAGDLSAPGAALPWFVSTSMPRDQSDLDEELARVSTLAVFLPPPTSHFPWFLVTGR